MTRSLLSLPLCLVLACGSAQAPAAQPAPAETVAQTPAVPLEVRVERARARREEIARWVESEDGPRKGKAKAMPVAAQIHAESEAAARSEPSAPYAEADVARYEEACARLEAAYLDSQLESTDPVEVTSFAIDERRDVLGSPTVDAKLGAWQARDAERPFVKFAVVRNGEGKLEVHVGPLDVAHVEIAGGPALAAGLLQVSLRGAKTVVTVLENTSGGYRPGPLRNRTTLDALAAAGYLPEAGDLVVHANPSGGYETSRLFGTK